MSAAIKVMIVSILAAAVLSFSPATAAEEDKTRDAAGEVVSSSLVDIDGDNARETVEIYLSRGLFFRKEDPWCAQGLTWEGDFHVRVLKEGKALYDSYAEGRPPLPVPSLKASRFQLQFGDYNGDGDADFNLATYATCDHYTVRLFTIRPDGKVEPLAVSGTEVSVTDRASSTGKMCHDGMGGITYKYHNESGWITESAKWDGKAFVPERRSVLIVDAAGDTVEEYAWENGAFVLKDSRKAGEGEGQ